MLVADRLVFLYLFDLFVGGYIIGEHVGVGNEGMGSFVSEICLKQSVVVFVRFLVGSVCR